MFPHLLSPILHSFSRKSEFSKCFIIHLLGCILSPNFVRQQESGRSCHRFESLYCLAKTSIYLVSPYKHKSHTQEYVRIWLFTGTVGSLIEMIESNENWNTRGCAALNTCTCSALRVVKSEVLDAEPAWQISAQTILFVSHVWTHACLRANTPPATIRIIMLMTTCYNNITTITMRTAGWISFMGEADVPMETASTLDSY